MKTLNTELPRHIAVIMDGNGRWAKKRHLPRIAGHKAGAKAVRRIVRSCAEKKIEVLTLFAFSSENWKRPLQEVNFLMDLFIAALKKEAKTLHDNNIQLHVIGDCSRFDAKLQKLIREVQELTANNTGLKLVIAANYGGRWDISESLRQIAQEVEKGAISSADISFELIQQKAAFAQFPDPDILIRTSGERRISNFMLWQLADTQLYFTDVLWPDFDGQELEKALREFVNIKNVAMNKKND